MADTLFISDLHLSDEAPHLEAALKAFLHRERGAKALYVLGDLFEVWIGDDDDAPLATRIANHFAEFAAEGSTVFFMGGNRDFLLGADFARRAGGTLLPEAVVVNLAGTPTLLMHGDTLCTDDVDYQQFRKMAHDPAWQADALSKSLAERRLLATMIRTMSKDAGSNKAEDIMDVTESAVLGAMQQFGVKRLIHGHTHRPGEHHYPAGERWVLGDWWDNGWTLRANDTAVTLSAFPIR